MEQNVVNFIHFKEVKSHLRFSFLERAEKNEIEVFKKLFFLQKKIFLVNRQDSRNDFGITICDPSNEDLLNEALVANRAKRSDIR